jgi:Uma2 family endonuclease
MLATLEAEVMAFSSTRSEPTPPTSLTDRDGAIPPLENGDRLTRPEFERRYDATPSLKNAELIEGLVFLRLTIPHRQHGGPHARLIGWLGNYSAYTPGVDGGNSCHIRMDRNNMPQPDGILFIRPECGSQVRIDADDYLDGAPDLIGEVAATGASLELHDKLVVYRRNDVREYIVWRVFDRQIDWFVLRAEGYVKLTAGDDGVLRSTNFPGLWLDPGALLREDHETLLAVLRRGRETPEHAAFVEELRRARVEPKA